MRVIQQATSCAWCLEEQEETLEEGSHGICSSHANAMLAEYYWQRLQAVPSYVEAQAALFAQEEDEFTGG